MLGTHQELPERFADLQGFAEVWALETMKARHARRVNSSNEERAAFYAAFAPRLEEALQYLNGFPLHDMPPRERNLLHLTYSLAEVALAVEVYNPAFESEHAKSSRKIGITGEID